MSLNHSFNEVYNAGLRQGMKGSIRNCSPAFWNPETSNWSLKSGE